MACVRIWVISLVVLLVVSGCNTVAFEYNAPVIRDDKKYFIRDSTEEKKAFLKNAAEGEGYYSFRMQFIDSSNRDEWPDQFKNDGKPTISHHDACSKKVKSLDQRKITGFAGIYVGPPITVQKFKDVIENPDLPENKSLAKNLLNNTRVGHFFVVADPENGSEINCYVDEQDLRVIAAKSWDKEVIQVNIIWFNSKEVDTQIGEIVETFKAVFKAAPLKRVFALSELVSVTGVAEKIDDVVKNYLSGASLSIKPQKFLVNSSHEGWDQQTRRYLEVRYLVRDEDNKIVGQPETVGYVELQLEVQPSVFGKSPALPRGYPDFSELELKDLPNNEVMINGNNRDIVEMVNFALNDERSTFDSRCDDLETVLKDNFKLAKIDRSAVLALFAKKDMPDVFTNQNNIPEISGLENPVRYTEAEPLAPQESEQMKRKKAVEDKIKELKEFHEPFSGSCLDSYVELMEELKLTPGKINKIVRDRIAELDEKLPEYVKPPNLSRSQKIQQVGFNVNAMFKDRPGERTDDRFAGLANPVTVQILASKPTVLADFGSGQSLSPLEFKAKAENMYGQLGCFLDVVEKEEGSELSRSQEFFGEKHYDMVAIYDDLFRDERGTQLGNKGYAMVLVDFDDTTDGTIPNVKRLLFVDPKPEHVNLIANQADQKMNKICFRPMSNDPSRPDAGGILTRFANQMGVNIGSPGS